MGGRSGAMNLLRISIPGVHPSTRTIESMVQLYGNKIYKLAYHMTGSSDDAEDVVQEVFLKLFRNWAQIGARRNLSAWIHRIVSNASLDLLRSRQARRRREVAADSGRLEGVATGRRGDRPEDRMDGTELNERLSSALSGLSPQLAVALILFDHEGLKAREIAEILNVAEATVRGYVSEARQRVKETLTPYLAGRAI
jgi:RNA polymerase sigma-70 factor (ECF subfamily)